MNSPEGYVNIDSYSHIEHKESTFSVVPWIIAGKGEGRRGKVSSRLAGSHANCKREASLLALDGAQARNGACQEGPGTPRQAFVPPPTPKGGERETPTGALYASNSPSLY